MISVADVVEAESVDLGKLRRCGVLILLNRAAMLRASFCVSVRLTRRALFAARPPLDPEA